jgi:predicted phosphoribosyltransferase
MPFRRAVLFADRADAGRQLAERLLAMQPLRPVVYALPRGGVPVAAEVAAALKAPLDLVIVRKLGAPGQPELAIGAVVDGGQPETVLNERIAALTGADDAYVAAARREALAEIERRRAAYTAGRPSPDPRDRTAILIDDGLATGATARAALHALRRRAPARLVLAVPLAPPDTLEALRAEADEILCLLETDLLAGVGGCYRDFHQLEDAEVIQLLDEAATRIGGTAAER